jgi:hydrogenase expression/formation protein HypE
VTDARIAREQGAHALHDVTEGGVVAGLWEMARASGLGIAVCPEGIPIRDETRLLCEAVGIDPLEAIGSGALVVAAPPERAPEMVEALGDAGIGAWPIGVFGEPGGEMIRTRGERTVPLVPPAVDAIATLQE